MGKLTRVEAIVNAIEVMKEMDGMDETVEVLANMKTKLEEKSTSRKPSKSVEANEKARVEILGILAENGGQLSIAEIKALSEIADVRDSVGVNKVSALLSPMVKDGRVVKAVVKRDNKRVTVFSLA